jgi:hypothetical protein
LASLAFRNEADGFVPASRLNQLRRAILADLQEKLDSNRTNRIAALQEQVLPPVGQQSQTASGFRWSVKIDRTAFLDAFENSDFKNIDEVIVDITRDQPSILHEKLSRLESQIGRDRIRLALPALTRKWEEKAVLHKVASLVETGWHKWEAANLSAWSYLGLDPTSKDTRSIDVATDWSIYVLNRLAALQLMDMGVSRFALSPEDGIGNWRSLLAEFGPRAVLIVHQDTPLFLAESCAYANLIGGCPGKANCSFQSMEMTSSHGEKVTSLDYHCRTIVLNQGPYCLSTRFKELANAGATSLRADFIYRPYDPGEVRDRWRSIRRGQAIRNAHCANFERGIL